MTTSTASKIVILLEHLLITIDILVNAFADYCGKSMIIRLSAYALQDMCLILSLIILFLLFFRTEILKSNLVWQLMSQHWTTFSALIVYFSLTITLQIMVISNIKNLHGSTNHTLNHNLKGEVNVQNPVQGTNLLYFTPTKSTYNGTQVDNNYSWMNDNLIVTFYILQRITSAIHYHFYRSATFKLHGCGLIQCQNRCHS